jgi:hypothetical protein
MNGDDLLTLVSLLAFGASLIACVRMLSDRSVKGVVETLACVVLALGIVWAVL